MTNKIWKAALYIRLSREDGDDKVESNSISNQKLLLNEFVKSSEEFTIVDTYVDDGFTGTNFDRPGFHRMESDLYARKFNTIIVKDLSRLGRNYIEVGRYIEETFPLYNIRFISVNDNIDSYKDPKSINSIIVPFKNLINDEYCRDISLKVRSALKAKWLNGEYACSMFPYGYLKDEHNHLIIDPEAAKVVKLIFEWTIQGKGRNKISNDLNEMGILSPAGHKVFDLKMGYKNAQYKNNPKNKYIWSATTVSDILKNEVYTGTMIFGRQKRVSYKVKKRVRTDKEEWIRVENNHEAIVSNEIFKKANEAKRNRAPVRQCKEGTILPLAGHIKCADCGRAMKSSSCHKYDIGKTPFYYYVCSTYSTKSKQHCTRHAISQKILNEAVLKTIQIQISTVANVEKVLSQVIEKPKVNLKSKIIEDSIIKNESELEKTKNIKKSLYEDWKLGMITREEYISYSKEYQDKMEQLNNRLDELYNESKNYKENIVESKNTWMDIFKKYKNITELTRDVVLDLIDVVYIHEGKKITIVFKYDDELKKY